MNILITGSNGYFGKSIIRSGIKGAVFFHGNRQTINLFDKESIKLFNKADTRCEGRDAPSTYIQPYPFLLVYACHSQQESGLCF